MLYQIHHQFKDKPINCCAQIEIVEGLLRNEFSKKLNKFITDTKKSHPLPMDENGRVLKFYTYMVCNEDSKHFVMTHASQPIIEADAYNRCFFCSTPTQPLEKGQECPKCGGRPA